MIKGKNRLTFFMILYSWLIIFFCLMTPPGSVHGDDHVSMMDHGKASISDLSTCGSCHSLHPEADTDPDSWGWEDNPGLLRSCGNEMDKTCDHCHQTTPKPSTGPGCTDCHIESPFVRQDCTSCHGNGPFGDNAPNRAGSHPAHALPGVNDSCSICHYGAGFGTDKHYDESLPADVAIMPEYNSKKGVASYDPKSMTCSNIRCHGGNTTPAWGDDYSIVENLDCRSCHEYKGDQYISIESIGHHEHINSRQERMANIQCNWCHDIRLLTKNHYKELETTDLSGKANETIYKSFIYKNINERGCAGSCHSGPNHAWGSVENANSPNDVNKTLPNQEMPAAIVETLFYPGKKSETRVIDNLTLQNKISVSPESALKYIEITSPEQTLYFNEKMVVSAMGIYCDGSASNINSDVEWTTDIPKLARIDSGGILSTGKNEGIVLITATDPDTGISGSKPIKIINDYKNSLDRIEIRSSDLFPVVIKGNSIDLTAVGVNKDGQQIDITEQVVWKSSSKSATVNNLGKVYGVSKQNDIRITATDSETGKTGVYKLNVVVLGNDDPLVITIEPYNQRFEHQARITFIATGHFEDGSSIELDSKKGEVYWTTTDAWVIPFTDHWNGSTMARDTATITITATDPDTGVFGTTPATVFRLPGSGGKGGGKTDGKGGKK